MKRAVIMLLSVVILAAGAALAQEATPPVTPEATEAADVPEPTVTEAAAAGSPVIVTLEPNDARSAACSAPTLPDFVPYVVRAGDKLSRLIAGQSAITVTQLAALNCLDDPDALPVGAVIWLPAPPPAVEATPEATLAPGATPEATSEVTPEVTPESTAVAGEARIDQFAASAETVVNTDTVTFRWQAQGTNAYFYPCPAEAACDRPQTAQGVPLAASVSIDGYPYAGDYRYRLDVDGTDGAVTQDVSISVTCAQEWLGGAGASPLCPDSPARTVFAVWQPFEHGVMIWFSDTTQIFVMTDDGTMRAYLDVYVEGQDEAEIIAPNERFTPTRGFGLLWRALGGADSPLGWGLSQEAGYDAARQAAGRSSYTTYIAGPENTVYAVTQLPGAETGYWTQVAG